MICSPQIFLSNSSEGSCTLVPLLSLMWIDTLDALAIGLLIFIFGGILAAFFFYLRTAL
jgi:hypothetical protein